MPQRISSEISKRMAHRDFLLQVLSLILQDILSHQATSLFLAQVHLVLVPVPSLSTVRLLSVVQTPSLSVLAPQHLEAHLLSQETKPILLTSQSMAETSRRQLRHLTSSMAQRQHSISEVLLQRLTSELLVLSSQVVEH
jgi:hypothetical protein